MAELASVTPYQLKIPDDGSYYQPRLQFHDWSPADFEGAYKFGPQPIPINAYSGAASQLGSALGSQFSPQHQAAAAQAQLAGTLATNTSNALTTAAQNQSTDAALNSGASPNLVDPSAGSWSVAGGDQIGPLAPTPNLTSSPAATNPGALTGTQTVRQTTYAPGEVHSDPDTDAGRTSTGGPLVQYKAGMAGTASVDPSLIPYGSIIKRADGSTYVAADTGSAVVSQTASQGQAPVIDFHDTSGKVPDYGQVTIIPPTANYQSLSPADKLAYHAAADAIANTGHTGATAADQNGHYLNGASTPIGNTAAAPQDDLPTQSSPPSNAPLFGFQPNVAPGGMPPSQLSASSGVAAANPIINGPQIPIGADLPTAKAVPAPVLAPPPPTSTPAPAAPTPILAPPPSAWQQRLTSALGTGHITVGANGGVGYETLAPLNALQQSDVNLAPLRANLEQQQVNQIQQKLDQERQLAPLTIQAEQAKIALAQRQADAAAQMSRASAPIIVPAAGTGTASSTGATPAPTDPTTAGAPGHVLVPRFVSTLKDGFPVQTENPTLQSSLNVANTHGVPTDAHEVTINGQPYIDTTSLGHATGRAAQSLEYQRIDSAFKGAPTVQPFLTVAGNNASIQDNAAIPPAQRTAADDDALMKSVAGVENPGGKPGEGELNAIAKTAGFRDDYNTLVSDITNKKRLLSDEQVANLAAVAQRKVNSLKPSFQAQLDTMTAQAKAANLDTSDVFGKAMNYYNSLGNPKAAGASTAPASPSTAGMIKMKSPSGAVGYIPQANVAAATAKGYTPAQQYGG